MRYALNFLVFLPALALVAGGGALAQLNNKPFSFNTPDGGVGMSMGGKQAILDREILGLTPDNLLRGPDGGLLDLSKGEGGAAIVRLQSGVFLPSYHGTSFRGDNEAWSAGVFNMFFEPDNADSFVSRHGQWQTGSVISTWTGRVTSDQPVSYTPENTVDVWTGMVVQQSAY